MKRKWRRRICCVALGFNPAAPHSGTSSGWPGSAADDSLPLRDGNVGALDVQDAADLEPEPPICRSFHLSIWRCARAQDVGDGSAAADRGTDDDRAEAGASCQTRAPLRQCAMNLRSARQGSWRRGR